MPDINAVYDLDFSKVQDAFAKVETLGKKAAESVNRAGASGAFRSQTQGAQKAAQSFAIVKQEAQAAGNAVGRSGGLIDRFSSRVKRAGLAAAGIASITVALVALNRRFPVIGQVASRSFAIIQQTATRAMITTGKFAISLSNLKAAAGAALGIYTLVRAFNALRTAASGADKIKLPKLSGAGAAAGLSLGSLIGGTALGSMAGNLGADAFKSVKDGIVRAVQSAGDAEQTQISFEVLTGSFDNAKQLLGEIQDLAANTPLTFGDLSGAGRQLAAFKEPLEQLPDTLRRIGDISSGIQAPIGEIAEIYGKARVQGTLFAEDINQLTGRGIDVITEFAGMLGVGTDQVKKLGSEGKITFPMLEQAFANLTDEGGLFYDMNARQSKTLLGLWSTLTDNFSMAFKALGSPINDALKPILERAIEMAASLPDYFAAAGAKIQEWVNFAHAFFTELSLPEMFAAAGQALELAFLKAVDLLARGLQAVYAASQDAGFMSGLAEHLRAMGVILQDSLMKALQAVFNALSNVKGLGFLGGAADQLGVARQEAKLAEAERRKRMREQGGPEPERDLMGSFKEKFAEAGGVFGEEIKKAGARLDRTLKPVYERSDQFNAEQRNRGEQGGGGGVRGTTGEMIQGEGRIALAGAFQQAKNLIAGKTINEVVAQETAKTNQNLGKLAAGQERMRTAIEKVERAVRDKKTEVEIDVVPTF